MSALTAAGLPAGVDLAAVVGEQPYPLVFATVSGAHLYGFPSRDSDVDLPARYPGRPSTGTSTR